jgi:hypothetical protein
MGTHVTHSMLGRIFWVSMLAVHVPACVRVWQRILEPHSTATQLGAGVWLAAAIVFFALKLIGLPSLRFATDRRSLCAIALAILLIHAGPLGFRSPEAVVPGNAPLIGSMLLIMGLSSVQKILGGLNGRRSYGLLVPLSGKPVHLPIGECIHCSTPLIQRAPRPPPA